MACPLFLLLVFFFSLHVFFPSSCVSFLHTLYLPLSLLDLFLLFLFSSCSLNLLILTLALLVLVMMHHVILIYIFMKKYHQSNKIMKKSLYHLMKRVLMKLLKKQMKREERELSELNTL